MASLIAETNHIRTLRLKAISALLGPLRKSNRRVACDVYKGPAQGGVALGAHDGEIANVHYRDWRFVSSVPYLRCNYFELWMPSDSPNIFVLNRAYLNIYVLNRESHSQEEIICLHCDPYEDSTAHPGKYKCGPHIHFSKASFNLGRSHVPLNLPNLDVVLSSMEELTNAMKEAIWLIRREIIDRFSF